MPHCNKSNTSNSLGTEGSKAEAVQTRKRGSQVFRKAKNEAASASEISFGWQATHRPNLPERFGRSGAPRSAMNSRGDPTLPRNYTKSENETPFAVLEDSKSVEDEYFQRQRQAQLRNAVREVHSKARGDPVYKDSPFSPPSGRMLQSDIAGPFAYATGLEPVQEFLGNLSSINSESSLLSSYNSFDDKRNKLLA